MLKVLPIVFSLALMLTPAAASEPVGSAEIVSRATAYLDAYSTFDPEKIAPFLSDDAVFEDPTSTDEAANGGPFLFNGKAAILEGLGEYAAQYNAFTVSYEIERQYESNGSVVFVARLSYTAEAKDGRVFTGAAPIVTVVQVRDGMIVRHTDYYDYAGNAVEFGTAAN